MYLYIKKKIRLLERGVYFLSCCKCWPQKEATEKTSGKPPRRSHHHRMYCRVSRCSYFGSSLKRRLKIHVKTNNIREEDIPWLASVMTTSSRKWGKSIAKKIKKITKPGCNRKRCSAPGCNSAVLYLLTYPKKRPHDQDGSVEYKVHL